MFGVGILLKADDLAIAQLPHMGELRVYRSARRLYLPSVSPFNNDSVATLNKVLRKDGETLYALSSLP